MRTILITGGSHGLGRAIAAHYAKDSTVIILSSAKNRLEVTAQEIGCEFEVCDAADWQSVAAAIKNILNKHPQIDVLINNAGLYSRGSVEDIDPTEAARVYQVNALGPLFMTKAIVPSMKQRKEGVIININTQGGLYPKAERTIYQGSKWALTGITKCLQLELAPFGIKVTGLYPGALERSMESSGEVIEQPASVDYVDVVEAIDYILTRKNGSFVPELGVKGLGN